jgi:lipoprotein-anchoring transpeptidase ErfK/SrfK
MQRLIVPALLTSLFTITGAAAGPLSLQGEFYADYSVLTARGTAPPQAAGRAAPSVLVAEPPAVEAPPARTRVAAADGPNYGGGFFEMLFRGPGAPQYAPRYEQQPGYYRPAEPAYGGQDQTEPGRYSAEPARPGMNPRYLKQEVRYEGRETPGTVIINTTERHLYLVTADGRAVRYGIGVGRPGFTWAGTHHVSQKREWPDWTPPPEMLKRRPDLPRHMAGGPDNPLGARAMYLGSSLYRIHGSNEPWTIGQAVSSGCIRMRNEDVIDLYEKIKVGTKVVVI